MNFQEVSTVIPQLNLQNSEHEAWIISLLHSQDLPSNIIYLILDKVIQNDAVNIFNLLIDKNYVSLLVPFSILREKPYFYVVNLFPHILEKHDFNILKNIFYRRYAFTDNDFSNIASIINPLLNPEICYTIVQTLSMEQLYRLAKMCIVRDNYYLLEYLLNNQLPTTIPGVTSLLIFSIQNRANLNIVKLLHQHGPPFIQDLPWSIVSLYPQVYQIIGTSPKRGAQNPPESPKRRHL